MGKILTETQIEQFIELGWVKVEEAFPRRLALQCQDFLWEQLKRYGIERENNTSWTKPIIYMQEAFRSPEFDRCNSERLGGAIEDLIGTDRWTEKVLWDGNPDKDYPTWGCWPVNFHLGGDKEWTVPHEGWHWDGSHFRHYVDAPEQGLLCLCIFSDIREHGGGTFVAEGSHQVVARYLAGKKEGVQPQEGIDECNLQHRWLSALTGQGSDCFLPGDNRIDKFMNNTFTDDQGTKLRVMETTAAPGDVILCHPFLYHTASQNHSSATRFMCNRTTPLRERMNLQRNDVSEHSPLEISIRRALSLA